MFTADDYQKFPHYGHSRPRDALDVCREAGAGRLILFHHAPERSDVEVDAILADARAEARAAHLRFGLDAAYEGLELELGTGASGAADGKVG
jgi:ribonuclease BN (tRNA processing enzyme)